MANITILNAYIGNYDGNGEWVDMTLPLDEIEVIASRYTNNGQRDLLISDYESSYIPNILDIDYMSLDEVKALADTIQSLVSQYSSVDMVRAIIGAADDYRSGSETISDFIDSHEFYIYEDCNDMADVAYQVLTESGQIDELPEWARDYFDFTAFGRDLEIEGQFYRSDNGIYVEING